MTYIEKHKEKEKIIALVESLDDDQLDKELSSILKGIVSKFPVCYSHPLKGNSFKRIVDSVLRKTQFLDQYASRGFQPKLTTRVYYAMNEKNEIEHCQNQRCPNAPHNEYLHDISASAPLKFFHCNTRCAQQNEAVIAKVKHKKEENHTMTKDLVPRQKERCKAKYGVESYFQTDEFKEKAQAAWQKNGYDHPMHSDKIKKEMGDRLEAQYGPGVRSNWQIPTVQEKIKARNQEAFGVDYPMQSKELHDVMHYNSNVTKMRNYYRETICCFSTADPMFTEDEYIAAHENTQPLVLKWRCKNCGDVFEQRLWLYDEPRCLECDPLIYDKASSKFEEEVAEFVKAACPEDLEVKFQEQENWNVLSGNKQLDIICISKSTHDPVIAFELNGLYWHSAELKKKDAHLSKTQECESLGIVLVHIWEDEWQDIMKREETKKLIEMMLQTRGKDLEVNALKVRRDKFCRLCTFKDADVVSESAPEIETRSIGSKSYDVYACGELTLEKV